MLLLVVAPVRAQEPTDDPVVTALLSDPATSAARRAIRDLEPSTLETQVALCEIPAPPFGEAQRAEAVRRLFEGAGLLRVRIDLAGNVIGDRAGRGQAPRVVVSSHLDTVFPEGTDVRIQRSGKIFKGPGISDDCRGLAVMIAVARALEASAIKTGGPLTFVATVGEEGLGNLRGVRHLFETELRNRIDRFLSFDGGGLDLVTRGVGSKRYRVVVSGPGGHSYGSFGMANPVHALGRAIAAMADLVVPSTPRTTFNVGRIGGGTAVNAIASEAWMEIDLRSSSRAALMALDGEVRRAVEGAIVSENRRWGGRNSVRVVMQLIGERPAGASDERGPLVRRAVAASAALGAPITTSESSTDANIPMSIGIPAITLGVGGTGAGEHSLDETFDSTDSEKGTERALLILLAAASAAP
jgi:tripeptide aminopeptidase